MIRLKKRRKKGLILSQNKRQLILYSTIIDMPYYSKLKALLTKYEKIYETDFEDLEEFDEEKYLNMLYRKFPILLKKNGTQKEHVILLMVGQISTNDVNYVIQKIDIFSILKINTLNNNLMLVQIV